MRIRLVGRLRLKLRHDYAQEVDSARSFDLEAGAVHVASTKATISDFR